ncbi:unnamed protein product [Durusdinium trenchii]|uniref:J domain-containing protein n=1 Tax=Durusdinium trenchii TaxID=1381693 RepID=A0ABP0RVS3_9DINO
MPCPYKTLDVLPSANENEIRSAYRRRALTTHPDKGGSAEAFRCVVEAFESLVDANRRQSLSAVSPEKPKQKPERPGRTGRPAPPTARPTPTGHVPRAPTARHAPRARPKGPSSGDAAKSRGVPKAAATSKAESSNHVDYDEMLYRFMYGERKKPKIMAALRELSEEVLQGFARYLESDTLRKPTRLALEACPAKRRRRRKAPITQEEAQMPKLSRGIVRQHRRLVNGYYIDYSASVGFHCMVIRSQSVRSLDEAIDFHISLVKVRQCFLSNLKSGTGLGPSLREAIHTVVSERRAAQLPRLRMAFRFRKGRHMSLSFKESDLDGFITTWQDMAKTYHVRQPRPPRDAHVAARRRTRVSHEERAKRTEAKFQAKLSFLRKAISRTLLHLAKRRKRTCKKWGVEELPDGITVCSFQEPQDSLCAMVRLSDGTQRPGPYRKRLREAERDLTELRRLGRSGDAALLAELFRRDADAMTAFFVQGLGQPKQKRQKKRGAGALASLEILSSATPFVLPQLPVLVDLFADSKLGAPAQKAAKAIVSHLQPKGHGIASEAERDTENHRDGGARESWAFGILC